MKEYSPNTRFRFGKHINKTLEEVFDVDPGYIDWCLIYLDHFLISEYAFDQIHNSGTNFKFSKGALAHLAVKRKKIEDQYDYPEERETYGRYAGTYAQDQEWLSDNLIDDALDGFPDAYWNID